jgi:hypothetical protein
MNWRAFLFYQGGFLVGECMARTNSFWWQMFWAAIIGFPLWWWSEHGKPKIMIGA